METTNVNTKLTLIDKLNSSSPAGVANLPEVADRFKNIYKIMNGGDSNVATLKYEAEKFHFMKLITDNAKLQQCTKLSLYGCFIDMAVNGLSFDPGMKHAYVIPDSFKVIVQGRETWEQRATLRIDGRGELVIRQKQGQIKYADNPVLVFDGDEFVHGTKDDKVYLEHKAIHPRKKDSEVIACYLRIERPDASVDYKVFGIDEIMKLKSISKQPNSVAWTAGLNGMIQTKTIKHAFRSYPKVKLGNFSKLETEVTDHNQEMQIDYGIADMQEAAIPAIEKPLEAPVAEKPKAEFEEAEVVSTKTTAKDNRFNGTDDDFAEESPKPKSAGKKFEDDEF